MTEQKKDKSTDKKNTEGKQAETKKKKGALGPILIVCLILCLGVFGFSAWKLYGIFSEYHKGDVSYEKLDAYVGDEVLTPDYHPISDDKLDKELPMNYKKIDHDALYGINSEYVGWLYVADTNIDYPCVQGEDNDYYLRHTFSRDENIEGAVFLDARISQGMDSKHISFHAHYMKNDSMFGTLNYYMDEEFFREHPVFWFYPKEGGAWICEIFSAYTTGSASDAYTYDFESDAEYFEFVKMLKDRSDFETDVELGAADRIITLSTCTNEGVDRYVVHAKIVPVEIEE